MSNQVTVVAKFHGTVGYTQSSVVKLLVDRDEWDSTSMEEKIYRLIEKGTVYAEGDNLEIQDYGELLGIVVQESNKYRIRDNNDLREVCECLCGHDFYEYYCEMPNKSDPKFCPNCGIELEWDQTQLTQEEAIESLKVYKDSLVHQLSKKLDDTPKEDDTLYFIRTNLKGVVMEAYPITKIIPGVDYIGELQFTRDGRTQEYYSDYAGEWDDIDQFLLDKSNGSCHQMLDESQRLFDEDIRDNVYMEWWRTTLLGESLDSFVGLWIGPVFPVGIFLATTPQDVADDSIILVR